MPCHKGDPWIWHVASKCVGKRCSWIQLVSRDIPLYIANHVPGVTVRARPMQPGSHHDDDNALHWDVSTDAGLHVPGVPPCKSSMTLILRALIVTLMNVYFPFMNRFSRSYAIVLGQTNVLSSFLSLTSCRICMVRIKSGNCMSLISWTLQPTGDSTWWWIPGSITNLKNESRLTALNLHDHRS